jgi:hypothetical protein
METVFDESGTDAVYTKIDLTVQVLINKAFFTMMGLQTTDALADGMRYIRYKLLQPRKALSVKVGDKDLVPGQQIKNQNRTVDAKNGPQTKCTITELTENSFLVTFQAIGHYWENYNNNVATATAGRNQDGNSVISCRWSESQEIDARNFSKRIRDGVYIIRSDNTDRRNSGFPDFLSGLAVCGINPGFVRKVARYTVQPDGLAVRFYLEDQEVYLMPPLPAFEAQGYYSETTQQNGATRYGECWVKLYGNKGDTAGEDSKDVLLTTALLVMIKKLKQVNTGDKGSIIAAPAPLRDRVLISSLIKTELYDNVVEVRAVYQLGPYARKRAGGVDSIDFTGLLNYPFGSEPGTPRPATSDRGSSRLLLQAAAYFDPSLRQELSKPSGQFNVGAQVGTE